MKTICKITLILLALFAFTSCDPEKDKEYRYDENDEPSNVSTKTYVNKSIC